MEYRGVNLSVYPICDTDIWVNAVLAKLDEELIEHYGKIVVADVVEREILNWKTNDSFSVIATKYLEYRDSKRIIVIYHRYINTVDQRFMEKQLIECNDRFETGLRNIPPEKHKGEIVSAIYAIYFNLLFLKSNDNAFKEGEMGKVAFPELIVKDLEDMLQDLLEDDMERGKHRQLIQDNRALMDEQKRLYEQKRNKPVTAEQVSALLTKLRGSR